jgi:putative ABC transport system permease protein
MNWASLINVSEHWFRLLLHLYPADFRSEMGDALVQTYRDRSRNAMKSAAWVVPLFSLFAVCFAALHESLRNGPAERLRPAAGWRRSGNWGRDTERVLRRLVRAPLFVVAVVATLTIGFGGVAVVYTAVDKILLEPMPYRNPGDLYFVWRDYRPSGDLARGWVAGPDISELQNAGGPIEDVAGMQLASPTLSSTRDGEPSQIRMMLISPNLFELLGIGPAQGRAFQRQEVGPKRPSIVVLSDGLWKRLGSNPSIIGSEVWLSGTPYTVIGVMPSGFRFLMHSSLGPPQEADLYIPFRFDLASQPPNNGSYAAIIRARRGTRAERVAAAVSAVGRIIDERDNNNKGLKLYSVNLQADLVKDVRPALFTLALAGLVLVLALTVNFASLLLARAAEREREVAVSRALGANGIAIVRAMVLEGGVLGLLGGIGGAFAGVWGTRLLVALAPLGLPRKETIVLDWKVASIVIAIGALVGLMAALIPATWASRLSVESLVAATATRGAGRAGRMRRGIIVAQVALSLMMLSAGGLIVRSFETLLRSDPGFRSDGVLTTSVAVGPRLFPKNADAITFEDRVEATLAGLPGITRVSATSALPLSAGALEQTDITMPGAPGNTGDSSKDSPQVDVITVRPGYVETMGIRLLEGRDFQKSFRQEVNEVLIDRHLAQQFFPMANPVGAKLMFDGTLLTIVGVIQQARLYTLYEDGRPQILVRPSEHTPYTPYFTIRTDREPDSVMAEVRAAIHQVDARIPVTPVRTMNDIVTDSIRQQRISAVMIAGFAVGAFLLLLMGLFGLISSSVARRRGELAVRLALGATHGRVIQLVIGEGTRLLALGFLLGIPGVYVAGQVMRGVLVGVSPFDPRTLIAVAAGFIGLALVACYLAARRVIAIAPERLLRDSG